MCILLNLSIIDIKVNMVENIPLYLYFKKYGGTEENFAFHACPWSVVQSIIHYGLHSSHCNFDARSTRETLSAVFRL